MAGDRVARGVWRRGESALLGCHALRPTPHAVRPLAAAPPRQASSRSPLHRRRRARLPIRERAALGEPPRDAAGPAPSRLPRARTPRSEAARRRTRPLASDLAVGSSRAPRPRLTMPSPAEPGYASRRCTPPTPSDPAPPRRCVAGALLSHSRGHPRSPSAARAVGRLRRAPHPAPPLPLGASAHLLPVGRRGEEGGDRRETVEASAFCRIASATAQTAAKRGGIKLRRIKTESKKEAPLVSSW